MPSNICARQSRCAINTLEGRGVVDMVVLKARHIPRIHFSPTPFSLAFLN